MLTVAVAVSLTWLLPPWHLALKAFV